MIGKLLEQYRGLSKQVKVVFWFTFVGFLQRGVSLITTPIFTRVLSTEDYGLFSVFQAYYAVIVIVVTLYLHMGVINNAFVKSGKSQERVVSSFQSLSLISSGVWFVIAFIFREQLSTLMGLPVIAVVIMFVAFMFVEPYNTWVIYKRYQFDYVRPVITSVLISIFTPAISVIAVFTTSGNHGIARIVSYSVVNVIIPGAIFYCINYKKDRTFVDKDLWKYALSFNVPLLGHYLSETLLNQTDRIMINSFLGSSEAGIYSVAFSAASLFTIFSTALNTAFVPWTYQKLQEKEYRSIEKMGYIVLSFLAVILSVMVMFAPEVVAVLAGSRYTGAVYLIPTLSASVFFGYMYQLFSRVELYYEKKSYTVISTVTAAVVNIILNVWWIPKLGYTAAGYSTLVSHMLFCVMHYFFFRKVSRECMDLDMIYDFKNLLAISVAVLAIAFVMTLLYNYLLLRLIIVACIFVVAFLMRKKIVEIIKTLRSK
ncbi:MAG: oligosaccharide flippase family protein [Lachnospiraceae bacterium]|nr:oligosaccharide flippase family protein [Lachnospiraceae bacterium]